MGECTESAWPELSLDFSNWRREGTQAADLMVGFSEGFGELRIVKRKAK